MSLGYSSRPVVRELYPSDLRARPIGRELYPRDIDTVYTLQIRNLEGYGVLAYESVALYEKAPNSKRPSCKEAPNFNSDPF